MKQWLVYILKSVSSARTYVGSANDFTRRLRQHNGIITGGARYTRGNTWVPLVLIQGFSQQHSHALQFEWALKNRKRIPGRTGKGVAGRVAGLHRVLCGERATAKAPLLSSITISLEWHDTEAHAAFEVLTAAQALSVDVTQVVIPPDMSYE